MKSLKSLGSPRRKKIELEKLDKEEKESEGSEKESDQPIKKKSGKKKSNKKKKIKKDDDLSDSSKQNKDEDKQLSNEEKSEEEKSKMKKTEENEEKPKNRLGRLRLQKLERKKSSKASETKGNEESDNSTNDKDKPVEKENSSQDEKIITKNDKKNRKKKKDKTKQDTEDDENSDNNRRNRTKSKSKREKTKKKEDSDVDKESNQEESEEDTTNAPRMEHMRRAPKTTDKRSRRHQDRIVSESYPEVHVIGQIIGGHSFGTGGFTCKWNVDYGHAWTHISGYQLGQSHIDYPSFGEDIIWAHPIDLHFATETVQGWPRLQFQIWHIDEHSRASLSGYCFAHIPSTPGYHKLHVQSWRPLGSSKEELEGFFLGCTPQLLTDEVLFNKAWSDRCRLRTESSGEISIELDIIVRNFQYLDLSM